MCHHKSSVLLVFLIDFHKTGVNLDESSVNDTHPYICTVLPMHVSHCCIIHDATVITLWLYTASKQAVAAASHTWHLNNYNLHSIVTFLQVCGVTIIIGNAISENTQTCSSLPIWLSCRPTRIIEWRCVESAYTVVDVCCALVLLLNQHSMWSLINTQFPLAILQTILLIHAQCLYTGLCDTWQR